MTVLELRVSNITCMHSIKVCILFVILYTTKSERQFSYISPCPEDSRLVRIVVPCAQMRLPGSRAILKLERAGASAARFNRPAQQATEPRAKLEAIPALCDGLVVDSMFERSENVAIAL